MTQNVLRALIQYPSLSIAVVCPTASGRGERAEEEAGADDDGEASGTGGHDGGAGGHAGAFGSQHPPPRGNAMF